MGLDNGIVLVSKRKIDLNEFPNIIFDYYKYDADCFEEKRDDGKYKYEVCYWRKFLPLRNSILGCIGCRESNDSTTELSIDDLNEIRNIICLNLFTLHNDSSGEYWDQSTVAQHYGIDLSVISWLMEFLEENPLAYCYFYDSY